MSTVVLPVTHPVRLTERINRIEPSATMAVVAEADKLRQQGIDVVDFGAGEPHFSTPQHIKDAAIAAIQANFSKYTPVGGTAEVAERATVRGFAVAIELVALPTVVEVALPEVAIFVGGPENGASAATAISTV